MKKTEINEIIEEVHAMERGELAPGRVWDVQKLPDGSVIRKQLDPETYRQKQARAWQVKTEAAKVRHELNLTQEDFAKMIGVSLATVRKWERGIGEPSGAAKTLLAVARLHPNAIREALALA